MAIIQNKSSVLKVMKNTSNKLKSIQESKNKYKLMYKVDKKWITITDCQTKKTVQIHIIITQKQKR